MCRVCFIIPPRPWLVNPHAQAPMGILYLAAVLETEAGHDVSIVNLGGRYAGWDDVCSLPCADVFCLSGTWLDVPEINSLAEAIYEFEPGVRILVGGPIALSPDELSDNIDLVVQGEAETEICTLVESQSIGFHTCAPPTDLDALPFPARHLWAGPFGGNVFIGGENYFGGGSTTILSSRGCPYNCAFCASSALAPRKVRFRSAESVVEEMEQCVVDFGVRQFRFSDENFNANPSRVNALCGAIAVSDILGHGNGIAWRASIAVRPRSTELFQYMAATGCKEVSIGVESADPKVLELLCPAKLPDPAESMEALQMAQDAGLKTRALMIIGTPGENADTSWHNRDFFQSAPCDALAVAIFTPMPGSDIYHHPERYHCRLRSEMERQGQYLYGPQGRNPIEPAIELDDFPFDALRASMAAQVAAAEATGKTGRG